MSLKEIKDLVRLMRKEGIVSIKTSEIEMLINPTAIAPRRRKPKSDKPDAALTDQSFRGYTDEEVLSWSARSEE